MERGRVAQIFRSSSGITFLSFLATVIGFITQVILAARFGTAQEMDSYLVSATIPAMVLAIFIGSLNYTFIPVFVEKKTLGLEIEAWETVNNLFNLAFVILTLLTLLGFIFSEMIIRFTAPGLPEGTRQTANLLFKIQIPMIAVSGMTAILSGIYYAEKRFIYPSITTLANSSIIFITVFLFSKMGIQAAAWGGLAGSCLGFFMLLPALLKVPRYRFSINFREQGTVRIVRLMMPLLVGAIFYRADNLIQRYIASSLPPGSISYLGYSYKLVSTIGGLVVSGISIVFLQHISELSSNNDASQIGQTFSSTFRWLTFISIPVIVCMVVLGDDIIYVLFQRGRFDEISSRSTWICMILYSGVFYGGIIGSITNPIFYAYKNTLIVAIVGIVGAFLQVLLSFPLAKILSFSGLPLAYSISNIITIFTFIVILRRKYLVLPWKSMLTILCATCCAGSVAASVLWQVKSSLLPDMPHFVRLILLAPSLILLYLAICILFRVRESIRLVQYLRVQIQRLNCEKLFF